MLYNIPEMSVNDLGPYLTMIPFLQHIKLEECALTKASSLICSSLLGHNTTSQLQSCTLHGNRAKAGVILHDPIPSFYEIQQSLINLRIIMKDLISLKNLLQFFPKLLKLGKLTVRNFKVFFLKLEIYVN
jgi:hypothetical protein